MQGNSHLLYAVNLFDSYRYSHYYLFMSLFCTLLCRLTKLRTKISIPLHGWFYFSLCFSIRFGYCYCYCFYFHVDECVFVFVYVYNNFKNIYSYHCTCTQSLIHHFSVFSMQFWCFRAILGDSASRFISLCPGRNTYKIQDEEKKIIIKLYSNQCTEKLQNTHIISVKIPSLSLLFSSFRSFCVISRKLWLINHSIAYDALVLVQRHTANNHLNNSLRCAFLPLAFDDVQFSLDK